MKKTEPKKSAEFEQFETFVRKIVKVPKAEIAKREAAEKKKKEKAAKKKA
jgi:hypothetical protein